MEEEESEQINYIICQKVTNALEQSQAGKGVRQVPPVDGGGVWFCSPRVIGEDLSDKLTFEQRP